jgi:diguanylate cyclase (GGDEF)-like protein
MFVLYILLDWLTTGIQNGKYILAGVFCLVSIFATCSFLHNEQPFLLKALWQEKNYRRRLEKKMRTKTRELQDINEELKCLALNDELTGLYNRRGFFTLAQHQMKLAQREQKDILVIFADIDDMKKINDSFGHQEGDGAIKSMAAILKDTFRTSDIVARIGGDEFAILSLLTSWDNAETLRDRLQIKVRLFNEKKLLPCTLAVSMGMALYPCDYRCTVEEMLQNADEMMYASKRNKRKTGTIG